MLIFKLKVNSLQYILCLVQKLSSSRLCFWFFAVACICESNKSLPISLSSLIYNHKLNNRKYFIPCITIARLELVVLTRGTFRHPSCSSCTLPTNGLRHKWLERKSLICVYIWLPLTAIIYKEFHYLRFEITMNITWD